MSNSKEKTTEVLEEFVEETEDLKEPQVEQEVFDPTRYSALDKELKKKFGEEYVGITEKKVFEKVNFIPLECLSINRMLGSGLCEGRIVEVFGPASVGKSSFALHVVKSFQKLNKACFWVDAEHCFSQEYALMNGVDIERLAMLSPSTANDALEAIRIACASKQISLVVLDSVAALVPKEEYEKDVGGGMIGSLARLMSSTLKQLAVLANQNNCTILLLNQERSANLTGYGCFHEDTLVTFTDGSLVPIRKIVEQRLEGPVLSFDDTTGQFVGKPITNWFNNGTLNIQEGETWVNVLSEGTGGLGGRMGFTATPNHEVLTTKGYKPAKELNTTDELISWTEVKYLNTPILQDIMRGTLLGDGSLASNRGTVSCTLQLQNNDVSQIDYLKWKLDKLSCLNMRQNNVLVTNKDDSKNRKGYMYNSLPLNELKFLQKEFYIPGVKRRVIPLDLELNPLIAAIWYMDDGTSDFRDYHNRGRICCYRIFQIRDKELKQQQIKKYKQIWATFLDCSVDRFRVEDSTGTIYFNTPEFKTLSYKIREYVIPSMQYKLSPDDRGYFKEVEIPHPDDYSQIIPTTSRILEVNTTSKRKLRSKTKYDIEIADTHNYLVGGSNRGVVVHNSKTATSGGNALGYYTSVRIDLNRSGYIETSSGEKQGITIKAQTVKNKTYTPFKQAEYSILFPHEENGEIVAGIDVIGSVLELAIEYDIITKAGSWLSFRDVKTQGMDKFRVKVLENPSLYNLIYEAVLNKLTE